MIPGKQQKSRRSKGYHMPPTIDPREKARAEYDKERAKRKRCRENNKNPETCKVCKDEHVCPTEATEDWLNSQKEQKEPQE